MANAISLSAASGNYYNGNDGTWKPYLLTIGNSNPQQVVQVLPSTVLADVWTISPSVCAFNTDPACASVRGGTFDISQSTSFSRIGTLPNGTLQAYGLGIEQTHGWSQSDLGVFGTDNIVLQSGGQPVPVSNVVVGSMNTNSTALGLLGLHSKPVSFQTGSNFTNHSSVLQSMKDANMIPSLSYSYSAGSWYNKTAGLLVLGGYDANSYVKNDVQFPFALDRDNYLSVYLQSITTVSKGNLTVLADEAIRVLIDSTIAPLWLPKEICDSFADAFNLTYRQLDGLYLIDNSTHNANLAKNPTVAITIANSTTSSDTITLNFPYNAFDVPYFDTNRPGLAIQYFPLKIATDPNQFTLGRTFLQEAVITVDHERQSFSVSQVVDLRQSTPQIQNILSTTASTNGSNSATPVPNSNGGGGGGGGFPVGAIAGIVVAVVLIAAAIAGFLFFRRRRNQKSRYGTVETSQPNTPGPQVLPPANEKTATTHELHTPRAGASNDYFGPSAYAASMNTHHKQAMSNTSNELDGNGYDRGRARSPVPAPPYVPAITETPPIGATGTGALSSQGSPLVELPAGMHAHELHSRQQSDTDLQHGLIPSPASSPPVNSPISELAPSPGDERPVVSDAEMGWNSPVEEHSTSHFAQHQAYSPVRGAQIRDVRSGDRSRGGIEDAGVGSSRAPETTAMSATSGPMGSAPIGLGLGPTGDREPSEALRRNDSTRSRASRASDSTLVSAITGAGTLPHGGIPSALQSPNTSNAIPRKPLGQ